MCPRVLSARFAPHRRRRRCRRQSARTRPPQVRMCPRLIAARFAPRRRAASGCPQVRKCPRQRAARLAPQRQRQTQRRMCPCPRAARLPPQHRLRCITYLSRCASGVATQTPVSAPIAFDVLEVWPLGYSPPTCIPAAHEECREEHLKEPAGEDGDGKRRMAPRRSAREGVGSWRRDGLRGDAGRQ